MHCEIAKTTLPGAMALSFLMVGTPVAHAAEDALPAAPALARYTRDVLQGGVWKRPGLSPRDRSLVTVATLVARNQTADMPYEIGRALDNVVIFGEVFETITHLAFYSD